MPTTRQHTAHRGQILVIFAAATVLLIAFLAAAVDVGYLLSQRRGVQNAADAAALAVAHAVHSGVTNTATLEQIAAYYVEENGYDATPEITFSPDMKQVRVTVNAEVPKFFVGLVYPGDWKVGARAAASLEPVPFDAALLALNPSSGGIKTSGNTGIEVTGGSVMSNYTIETSGSTSIIADQQVNANDGFRESGASRIEGGMGTNPYAPEVPDPLKDKIQPPTLPPFPSNPVPNVGGSPQQCMEYPQPWGVNIYTVPAGTYSGGGGNCLTIQNVQSGNTLEFAHGNYRFNNGAGISIGGGNNGPIVLRGGNYTFNGGPGISVGGSTPDFRMERGNYAFLNGARLSIGGSANGNVLGGGTFYFSGAGSGILPGGSNSVTLNPGTYIFDGGHGMVFSGSSHLTFNPGHYEFWFRNGANLSFSGSSTIRLNGDVYVKMYFYDGSSLLTSGSTHFNLPSGEYYFGGNPPRDTCKLQNSGSTWIGGRNIFLFFGPGCYLHTSGSAAFAFTAPTTSIYPGYHPGVFMYAHPDNTETFQWNGTTSMLSEGTVYLPSAKLTMGGASNGKVLRGQIIVNSMQTGGSTRLGLEYQQYVDTSIPAVFLIE